MSVLDALRASLVGAGVLLFIIGSVGMLRFPDVYTRLHALTKADNLGLGLVVMGMILGVESPAEGAKLVLVWLLALLASACSSSLVARAARRLGIEPWRRPGASDSETR